MPRHHNVEYLRFPRVAKALVDLRYIRMFGVKGSRGARELINEDFSEYMGRRARGKRIRKAQRRRQRGR